MRGHIEDRPGLCVLLCCAVVLLCCVVRWQGCAHACGLIWAIVSNGVWLCTTLGYAGYTFSVGALAVVSQLSSHIHMCICARAPTDTHTQRRTP